VRRDDPATEENRGVDVVTEVGDPGGMTAVLVTEGKEEEEIAGRLEARGLECGGPSGTDSLEELQRRVEGGRHGSIVGESASVLHDVEVSESHSLKVSQENRAIEM
jgi:hypothetical protein